jgi:Family of unknown function (DUF6174)
MRVAVGAFRGPSPTRSLDGSKESITSNVVVAGGSTGIAQAIPVPLARARASPGRGRWLTPWIAALSLEVACGGAWLTRGALDDAESRWRSHSVESYSIEVSVSESDEAIRRVRVEVRDGNLVEATMVENGTERRIDFDAARPYTVDGLFQTLGEELAAGKRRYVRASFDSARGFPERIELGPLRGAPEATRWFLRVESFRVASPVAR